MAMPVTIAIKEENGKTGLVNLPAKIWQRGREWTFAYKSTSKIATADIDPDHILPDVNPENNAYSGIAVQSGLTAKEVIKKYIDAIGGAGKLAAVKSISDTAKATVQGVEVVKVDEHTGTTTFTQSLIVPDFNNAVVMHIAMNGDSISETQRMQPIVLTPADKNIIKMKYKVFPELNYLKPVTSCNLHLCCK